jgi:hypothetical protein
MIFGIVNRMRCPPDSHEGSYITFCLPSADAPFIPVHRTGFSGANFNKGSSLKKDIILSTPFLPKRQVVRSPPTLYS